jgi:hypothetical protein
VTVTDLATVVADAAKNTGATLRTGRLLAIGDSTLTVDIGGGQALSMPFVDTYTPILGDRVQVLQQGMVCLAFGAAGGMPDDNQVFNPSFELDIPGTSPPQGWSVYFDPAGTSDSTVKTDFATGWGAKHGVRWLELNHGVTAGYAGIYVSSTPIAVQPGQQWSAAAYAISAIETGASEPTLQIRLAFLSSTSGTYPASVVQEVPLQIINGPTGPQWISLREIAGDGATVPVSAAAMTVVLFTQMWGGSVYWDKVVCRRLS